MRNDFIDEFLLKTNAFWLATIHERKVILVLLGADTFVSFRATAAEIKKLQLTFSLMMET